MNSIFSTLKRASKSLLGEKAEVQQVNTATPVEAKPSTQSTSGGTAQAGKERDFSLRARRTSRVAMRLPLRLTTTDGSGAESTFTAYTSVINKNGAKIGASRPMVVNDLVKLSVVSTSKSSQAKVVWADAKPDSNGEYAFAVELLKPMNLFDLNFPPEEGEEYQPTTPRRKPIEANTEPKQNADNPGTAQSESIGNGASSVEDESFVPLINSPEHSVQEPDIATTNGHSGEMSELEMCSLPLPSDRDRFLQINGTQADVAPTWKRDATIVNAFDTIESTVNSHMSADTPAVLEFSVAPTDTEVIDVEVKDAEIQTTTDFTDFLASQSIQDELYNFQQETVNPEVLSNTAAPFEFPFPESVNVEPVVHLSDPPSESSAAPESIHSLESFPFDVSQPSIENVDAIDSLENSPTVNETPLFSLQIDDAKITDVPTHESFSIQLESEESLPAPQAAPQIAPHAALETSSHIETSINLPIQNIAVGKSTDRNAGTTSGASLLRQDEASAMVDQLKGLRAEMSEEFSSMLQYFKEECVSQTQEMLSKTRIGAEKELSEQVEELTSRVADRSRQAMSDIAVQIQERSTKDAEANWKRLQEEASTVISQLQEIRNEIVKQMPVLTTQILKECQAQIKRDIADAIAAIPQPTQPQQISIDAVSLQATAAMKETSEQVRRSFGDSLAKQAGEQQRIAIEQLSRHLAQQLPQLATQFEQHCVSRSHQLAESFLDSSTQRITALVNDASGRISELSELIMMDVSDQMNLRFDNLLEDKAALIDSKVDESTLKAQEKLLARLEEEQQTREKDFREQVILQIQQQFELARERDQENMRNNLAEVFQEITAQLKVS